MWIDRPLDDAGPHANARWADLLDNNVTSMLRLTRALLPLLADGASVINQSSIWGRIGVAGFSAYSASKHAVVGLTRSLALELGPRGIRVNAVCPGWVRTAAAMRSLAAMARERGCSEAEVERDILSRQAVPRMLEPADLAGVFLFLASPASRVLTGQCLYAASALLAHISCLGMWQVIGRFVFSQPSTWTEESMRRLLIWMVMLGVVAAFRQGALVSVDLMLRLSKGAWRNTVRTIITSVNLAFLSVVLYFGIDLVWRVRFQTFASMEISMGWAYAALPAGALLAMVAVVAHQLDPHDDELSTAQ